MVGQTISHYKILEKLGEGGRGEVYLAEDTELNRKVALKFLPPHYTSDAELKSRFRREAKVAAALNHPNIITVYEIGEHENRAFIAMQYVEGESLREKIAIGATALLPLPIDQILDMFIQICDGLNAAHQAGIIHRDIKPENIIIDKTGRVHILDFGLARMSGVTKLTREASRIGTISYMSPEQFQGEPVDQRADVWSVGVVLYEILTGQLPFQGEHEQAVQVLCSIRNTSPPARVFLREALWQKEMYKESLAEYRKTLGRDKELAKALERGYAESGSRGAMRALAQKLAARTKKRYVSPLTIARRYAQAQEIEPAFEWLEKAYEEHIPQILHLQVDPRFDHLHIDPRFQDLLRRIGFPEN